MRIMGLRHMLVSTPRACARSCRTSPRYDAQLLYATPTGGASGLAGAALSEVIMPRMVEFTPFAARTTSASAVVPSLKCNVCTLVSGLDVTYKQRLLKWVYAGSTKDTNASRNCDLCEHRGMSIGVFYNMNNI